MMIDPKMLRMIQQQQEYELMQSVETKRLVNESAGQTTGLNNGVSRLAEWLKDKASTPESHKSPLQATSRKPSAYPESGYAKPCNPC